MLLTAGVCALMGGVLFVLRVGGCFTARSLAPVANARDYSHEAREAELLRVPLASLEDADPSVVRDGVVSVIVDPERLLSESQRNLLGATVVDHLLARASPDASVYMRLVDAEPSRWLDASDGKAFELLTNGCADLLGESLPGVGTRDNLARFLQACNDRNGYVLSAAAGAGGSAIRVWRSRTRSGINVSLLAHADADSIRWSGPTTTPYRFRALRPSYEDVVTRDGAALIAEVAQVVAVRTDQPFVLYSKWYWDPKQSRWLCHLMVNRGRPDYVVIF